MAIIQAFAALWTIKIEKNGGHFEFASEDKEKDNFCHICIQKSRKANDSMHSGHSGHQQKYLKPCVI